MEMVKERLKEIKIAYKSFALSPLLE